MNEPTRSVLEKINTFRIVEVGDGGTREAMLLPLYLSTCTLNRWCWMKWCRHSFAALIQNWSRELG